MSRQAREGLPAEGGFRHSFFFFSAFFFCAGLGLLPQNDAAYTTSLQKEGIY
jgi:hypothetical protein